jgi:DNA-directed RNA polymerase subunit RPC12/RpoP
MVKYDCAECHKSVDEKLITRKIRCPFCSSKVLLKPSTEGSKVKLDCI